MISNALREAHIGLLNDIFSVAQDPHHPGMLSSVAQTMIEYLKRTPLTAAIKWEQYHWIGPLLELGENPNEFNSLGHTPLMAAAFKGNLVVFEMIKNKGGEIGLNHQSANVTGLGIAILGGNIDIIRLFLNTDSINPNMPGSTGFTPLHMAVETQKPEILKELLQVDGLVINPKSTAGLTPLHYAVMRGKVEIVQLLVDHHADIEAKTENGIKIGDKFFLPGSTPLSIAQQLEFGEIVTVIQQAHRARRSAESSSSELLGLADVAAGAIEVALGANEGELSNAKRRKITEQVGN